MSIEFLDPTHENHSGEFALAPRLATLDGTVVAIVSNGKKGTLPFFDHLEAQLIKTHGVAEVVRITKHNYSTPVDRSLLDDAHRWNTLIAGIGDWRVYSGPRAIASSSRRTRSRAQRNWNSKTTQN